jgi:ADP-heptose:LPS heptosyltransferase
VNYLNLIDMALANGYGEFAALIGPVELERTPEAVESLKREGANVIVNPSILNLATALSDASVYVGADCGVTHLAAMIGAPAIALFGPTDPRVWGPVGRSVAIIRSASGRMDDMPVNSTMALLDDHLTM